MMKSKLLALALGALIATQVGAEEQRKPQTASEKIGYAIGVDLARNFKKQGIEFDSEMAVQGIRDALKNQSQLSDDDVRKILSGFQGEVRRKMAQNRRIAGMENRQQGEAFLAANKAKPDVVTLASGVQYKIVKEGKGPKLAQTDTVLANYTGSLLDGTVFDQTEPGKPAELRIGLLIAGWKEVMSLMPVGSTWKVWVPAAQAYGARGAGAEIGPEETLVFDIELLGTKQ